MKSGKAYGQLDCFFFLTSRTKIRVFESYYDSHESALEMFQDAKLVFGEIVELVSTPAPHLRFIQTSGREQLILTDDA